jgi:glycosyltransferase involved in cell wall biosynthesis
MTAPVLLHVFATFAVGGPQVRFAALANHFGRGYRHLVVAMDGNYACAERLADGLDVAYPTVVVTKGAAFGNVRRFRGMLRTFAPDVLITYNWGAIEWAMANLPRLARHIHIEDGFGPEERETQIRRRVLTRRLVLARSTLILPSHSLERIATEIWRLDPRRIHYVPNGVDLSRFGARENRAIRAGDELIVGTVAALRAEKNLARLLRAFRLVAATIPAHLVIVGDGPQRAAVETQAQDMGLGSRVRFVGHVDEPAPFYADFDVFALSSDTEQMPLTVIEAMAAGVPIAATNVGDIRTMVAKENEPYITELDDASLADSVTALLRHPTLRERLGMANRAKAALVFDQAAMFRTYGALFDGVALPVAA